MEILQGQVFLSRIQFSVTAMFHMLWPLTTVGLSIILVVFEVLRLKTDDVEERIIGNVCHLPIFAHVLKPHCRNNWYRCSDSTSP